MLVKVVWGHISKNIQEMHSLTTAFRIWYRPDVWVKPVLSGSGLFFFENILGALRWIRPKHFVFPYSGPLFWWCEARGARVPTKVLKDPPVQHILTYWEFERFHQEWLVPVGYPYEVRGLQKYCMGIADEIRLVEPIDEYTLNLLTDADLQ